MFATARTAVAAPLASPSLKHVFELAHTHSPLIGLGIRVSSSPSPSSSSATACASSAYTGYGQPMSRRPPLARMQSHYMSPATPPRTPRLHCVAALPAVFSPLLLTPSGPHAPVAEGYFSNEESSMEIRGEGITTSASGVHIMNMPTTDRRRLATTTNNFRSTFRLAQYIANPTTPEVERVGLGIAGLVLSSLNPNFGVTNVARSGLNSPALDALEAASPMMSDVRSAKAVCFNPLAQVISSPKDAGYFADTELEASLGPQRRQRRRSGSASSGLRSCKDRVQTPFHAPNGEASWL